MSLMSLFFYWNELFDRGGVFLGQDNIVNIKNSQGMKECASVLHAS